MEQAIENKKSDVAQYTIQDLLPIALVFVVVAIAVAFGASVISSIQTSFTVNTTAYNATTQGLVALGNISSYLGLLATVVVAAVIIGVIVRSFGGAGGQ